MVILIVEDSRFSRLYTHKLIQEYRPEDQFVLASNADEGYHFYLQYKPDVILLDLLMPGKSGQELLTMIRQQDTTTKIIILSADVQKLTREEVERLGVSAFINKPITKEKADQITKLIEG